MLFDNRTRSGSSLKMKPRLKSYGHSIARSRALERGTAADSSPHREIEECALVRRGRAIED